MNIHQVFLCLALAVICSSCAPDFDYRESYTGTWDIEYAYERTLKDSVLESSVVQFEGEIYIDGSDSQYFIRIEIAEGVSETYSMDLEGTLVLANFEDYSSSNGSFFSSDDFYARSYILSNNGHEKRAWTHSGERVVSSN